ncbi:MAG: TetR/AcrR family transcriptional regulator, partial [Proteobacteria bacterium]
EVSKGHLKWKVSELARAAKVSRPLIYYHFGKTKAAILKECLSIIAVDYFGLQPERKESLESSNRFDSLLRTRRIFLANPLLAVFYQRARSKNGELGDFFEDIEKRFQKKLSRQFPKCSAVEIRALHGLLHGLITAPFLDEASFKTAFGLIAFPKG